MSGVECVVIISIGIIGVFLICSVPSDISLNDKHDFSSEDIDKIKHYNDLEQLDSKYQRCDSDKRQVILNIISKKYNLMISTCLFLIVIIFVFGIRWRNSVINNTDEWLCCAPIVICSMAELVINYISFYLNVRKIQSTPLKCKKVAIKYTHVPSSRVGSSHKRTSIAEKQVNGTILYYVIGERLYFGGESYWDQIVLADLYRYDDEKSNILVTVVRNDELNHW